MEENLEKLTKDSIWKKIDLEKFQELSIAIPCIAATSYFVGKMINESSKNITDWKNNLGVVVGVIVYVYCLDGLTNNQVYRNLIFKESNDK